MLPDGADAVDAEHTAACLKKLNIKAAAGDKA
jgi:hypothetical protein